MRITDRLIQLRAVAVNVGGFVKRHKRASMAVAVALVIAAPLPTGTGGETFLLNLVGLGVIALVVRRIMRARARQQARESNCRCHCHRQQRRNIQPAGQQIQQQGGAP